MKLFDSEERPMRNTITGKLEKKIFLHYQCTKRTCTSPDICFLESIEFMIPYSRPCLRCLRSYPFEEQERVMRQVYADKRAAMQRSVGAVVSHFRVQQLSDYDKPIIAYTRWIVI